MFYLTYYSSGISHLLWLIRCLRLSFGVSAQSYGKLREDAAVTDGKGMCGSGKQKQRRKQRAGRKEWEEEKKNSDRNKVYVSGWPPR